MKNKIPSNAELVTMAMESLEDLEMGRDDDNMLSEPSVASLVQGALVEAVEGFSEIAESLEENLISKLEKRGITDGSAPDIVASCRDLIAEAAAHSMIVETLSANGFDRLARVYMRAKR